MKTLASLLLLTTVSVVAGGCATPDLTPQERSAQILRNWEYEFQQAQEDIDHALLLRPASRMTIWNVR